MSERQANDHYPTDPKLAQAIVKQVSQLIHTPKAIIEPSAGTGAFVRACKAQWSQVPVAAIEIDPSFMKILQASKADHIVINDWVEEAKDGFLPGMLIIGNPPFGLAREHITAAIESLSPGDHAAFLLRMSFMGSQERVGFWKKYPARYLIPLVPRPNFMKGMVNAQGKKMGGDNSEYGVFVWKKGFTGWTELLPTLVWR